MKFRKILLIFISSLLFFIACSQNLISSSNKSINNNSNQTLESMSLQQILPDNPNLQYIGRVDLSTPQKPVFGYPATGFQFNFTGTNLQLNLADDNWGGNNYIGVYLDNNPQPIILHLEGGTEPTNYQVAKELEDKQHSALIVKRTDYIAGSFTLNSILIDAKKNVLSSPLIPSRKLEVYGDSISTGTTVEYQVLGTQDPEGDTRHLDNSYLSFPAMLAREYDASYNLIAQGGISLVDGYGYWLDGTGMEAVYDKFNPTKDAPEWKFNNNPELVIVALGQNDSSTINIGVDLAAEDWKSHYKQFISNLRSKYPDSYMICMFPNMYHDRIWDAYLTEAVSEYQQVTGDRQIYSLITEQVTPGHPREAEQRLMVKELKNLIDNTLAKDGLNWS